MCDVRVGGMMCVRCEGRRDDVWRCEGRRDDVDEM